MIAPPELLVSETFKDAQWLTIFSPEPLRFLISQSKAEGNDWTTKGAKNAKPTRNDPIQENGLDHKKSPGDIPWSRGK